MALSRSISATLFIVLFFLRQDMLFAQDQTNNLDKYWSYRHRLTTQFMVVGEGQGMSVPASRKDTIANSLIWSDATLALGWYCGVLATEYHLLTTPRFWGYDRGDTNAINQTLEELHDAIKALRRLDEVAESVFPPPCDSLANDRNGFFIRDDVPSDFFTHFPSVNQALSDFTTFNVYSKEMSQDQVYHILLGLALVKKFIPLNIEVDGTNLRGEAVTQAVSIVDWMSHAGWMIKNPSCLVGGNPKNVDRGEDARFFSPGTNEMIKYISGNSVDYNNRVDSIFYALWGTFASPTNPGYSNIDNRHMAMTIAAVGEGWGSGTLNALMELAKPNRWSVYPMLYVALHEDTSAPGFAAFRDTLNSWSGQMLDEAPPEGPYAGYPDTVSHGYAVFNRFFRDRALQYIGNPWTQGNKFNGLDYMLLHNLYYIFSPSKWPPIVNSAKDLVKPDAVSVSIFPNPVTSRLFVNLFASDYGDYSIEIYTSVGKRIFQSGIGKKVMEINTSNFPAGNYFLCVINEDGEKASARFYKE